MIDWQEKMLYNFDSLLLSFEQGGLKMQRDFRYLGMKKRSGFFSIIGLRLIPPKIQNLYRHFLLKKSALLIYQLRGKHLVFVIFSNTVILSKLRLITRIF